MPMHCAQFYSVTFDFISLYSIAFHFIALHCIVLHWKVSNESKVLRREANAPGSARFALGWPISMHRRLIIMMMTMMIVLWLSAFSTPCLYWWPLLLRDQLIRSAMVANGDDGDDYCDDHNGDIDQLMRL